jgi:glutathione S-transferase
MTLGTLYTNGPLCAFTHRVQIAAAELGAPIDVVYGNDIPAGVREANTNGNWPAFAPATGGDLLQDSSEIVDYLIDHSASKGEGYRSDPEVVATVDTLVGCISKVILAGQPRVQKDFRGKLERALADVASILISRGGTYLTGDRFSQADGHVAPFLHRLPFMVEIRNFVPGIFTANGRFSAWVDRVVNRKSFREIAPKRHQLRQFYAARASYGKPMKIGRLHHSGFRGMWNDVIARTSAVVAGDDRDNTQLQEARDLCYLLFRAVGLHAKFENLLLFPALDAATDDPGFTAEAFEQHEHEEGEMNSLLVQFDRALSEEPGLRHETLVDLASASVRLREGQFAHFEFEEANFLPVLSELELDQHLEMLHGAYEMCILERPHLIGVLASYMPIENTLSLLDSLLHAVEPDSEQWRTLLTAMHSHLSAEQWLRVMRRFEDVLPISLMVLPSRRSVDGIGVAARALQTAAPVERIEIPGVAAAG